MSSYLTPFSAFPRFSLHNHTSSRLSLDANRRINSILMPIESAVGPGVTYRVAPCSETRIALIRIIPTTGPAAQGHKGAVNGDSNSQHHIDSIHVSTPKSADFGDADAAPIISSIVD